ncbi:MAG TPA: glycosyltransferase [Oceanipulchritudo sp.]|nr:glycosyltransferase [Oceanipulchritudo sp.]
MKPDLKGSLLRGAAKGWIPARWVVPGLPSAQPLSAKTSRLHLEIVSHCWQYAHLLIYQLSSLVKNSPADLDVTMTVFYAREDEETRALLAFFGEKDLPSVTWNWRSLSREHLFRRAIGRNLAARETSADWIWFTDCDLFFGKGCLDGLAHALQSAREPLVFPGIEWCTDLLPPEAPALQQGRKGPQVLPPPAVDFKPHNPTRATGPLQITHGEAARRFGYCNNLSYYQQPASHWCKAHEDRAFRWLLGSQGKALDIPAVHRIRHLNKGRYHGNTWQTALRKRIRKLASKIKEPER